MIGFIPLFTYYFSYVADHYQYFACLGLIALTVAAAGKCLEFSGASRLMQTALATLLLLTLSTLTWRQCHIYKNTETLWTDTLQKNPRSWMAHTNLGRLLAQQGDLVGAEKHYLAAIDINPDDENAHYDYGNLLARENRLDKAEAQYRQTLKIMPDKADAHNNLASVLNLQHRADEAMAELRQAIACDPDYANAYYNLGNMLWSQQKRDEAVAAYRRAVQLKPDSKPFRKRLQEVDAGAN
jgi:tetratricopeptide (TPR) repeat protein